MNNTREAFELVWLTLPIPGEFDAMDACDQDLWRDVVEAAFLAGRASMAKVPEGLVSHDAYRGAMDDKYIWKQRALVADKFKQLASDMVLEWGNRGETTSLASWSDRCKGVIEKMKLLLSPLPKDDRTDCALRAVEARGIPDDATLNQSAVALAGNGKSEGTIPKDDTQADIGVDGQEAMMQAFEAAMVEGGYHKPERWRNDTYLYERDQDRFVGFTLRASPQSKPSIPAAQEGK